MARDTQNTRSISMTESTWSLRPYQYSFVYHDWRAFSSRHAYDISPIPPWRPGELPRQLSLVTWNADAQAGDAPGRMQALLAMVAAYLPAQSLGRGAHDPPGNELGWVGVCLQEVSRWALPALLANPWVQRHFTLFGALETEWPPGAHFGNVTMLSKAVPFLSAYAIGYAHGMQARGAVLVDVLVQRNSSAEALRKASVFRVANTHLESGGEPRYQSIRATQIVTLGRHLHVRGLLGGIALGDMNALSVEDSRALVAGTGLVDAWDGRAVDETERRGLGHTWWPRPSAVAAGREHNHPPGRLDRVLLNPSRNYIQVRRLRRIGVSATVDGREPISDHCGLLAGEVRFRS
jgi:endonuclease/exonuclease/phosphatase family metal-dependent hydrolase